MTRNPTSDPPPAWGQDDGVPAHATGVVVIDLARVQANWTALAALVAPAACAAVVKADAYGLGAAAVVPALAAAGCETFFVATAEEAGEVRRLAPAAVIYVLDGVLDPAYLRSIGARPVLSNPDDVALWASAIGAADATDRAAIQLDTGLNRLGLDRPAFDRLCEQGDPVRRLGLSLVMSHLACADEPEHPMNAAQRARFAEMRDRLSSAPASLAASDGLMLGPAYHFDLVRPGYALYGGQALENGAAPVRPVLRAYARIVQVRDVPAGEHVGYAASYTTDGPRRIATIAAGYADGVFRHASASTGELRGCVAIAGVVCPIVGRVSMDLVTVDVTAVPEAMTRPNGAAGWAELIGPTLSLETVGRHAGTIGYEVLTRLGRRFHRLYRTGAARAGTGGRI